MLPIHQVSFDKKAPRLCEEAKVDIQAVAKWFGEELFTYIRVFGITAPPHVLPWYAPDKLLAREISYQIASKGVTRSLKESKKIYLAHFSTLVWCLLLK